MSDLNLNKNVLSGSAEYTATAGVGLGGRTLASGDKLNMQFDNDVIIDDIVISGLGTADFDVELFLVFPTGHSMPVVTSAGAPTTTQIAGPNAGAEKIYQLNANEDNRNLWFRMPKWSTLQIVIGETISNPGSFQVSVLGRG